MAEMIRKVLDCEVKRLGERTFEFIASTGGIDRDGEVILPTAWDLKNFKKNPVIMYGHDYRGLPIGKAPKVWVDDGGLKNTVEFPPEGTYEFADIVRRLVENGYLKAESVGFIPREWNDGDGEKEPRRTYTKAELLEISIVPVPANPDALVAARDAGVITTKEFEAITKPETTENYHRVPVPGEEGKHDGHKIRTITISDEKGIKALYCVDCKKNITYLFDKDKWTMEEAEQWVRDHAKEAKSYMCECLKCGYQFESEEHCRETKCPKCGGQCRRIERPGPGQEEVNMDNAEVKGAISYQASHPNGTPKDEEGDWDAAREVRQAEIDDLKVMCAWVDSENSDNKTAYKLPHHRASGQHAVVWKAVAAAGAAIMGARGGVDIPEKDIPGVKAHLAKHYREFDREPPWEKGITQGEIKDEIDYLITSIQSEGLNDENKELAWGLVREIMRQPGSDIPVDILEKVGAVLNKKNRERLQQIKQLAQEVLDSAEPEKPEDDDKQTEPEVTLERVVEIVKGEVSKVIAKAQGKVEI